MKDIRDISVMWGLPPTRAMYRKNPLSLIGFVIGQKGTGSLFALLQVR